MIRCPHYLDGQNVGTRKGVVLSEFTPGSSECTPGAPENACVVWFYGLPGPATQDTTGCARRCEIEVKGQLDDLSTRLLRRIDTGLGYDATARGPEVRAQASLLWHRRTAH